MYSYIVIVKVFSRRFHPKPLTKHWIKNSKTDQNTLDQPLLTDLDRQEARQAKPLLITVFMNYIFYAKSLIQLNLGYLDKTKISVPLLGKCKVISKEF